MVRLLHHLWPCRKRLIYRLHAGKGQNLGKPSNTHTLTCENMEKAHWPCTPDPKNLILWLWHTAAASACYKVVPAVVLPGDCCSGGGCCAGGSGCGGSTGCCSNTNLSGCTGGSTGRFTSSAAASAGFGAAACAPGEAARGGAAGACGRCGRRQHRICTPCILGVQCMQASMM